MNLSAMLLQQWHKVALITAAQATINMGAVAGSYLLAAWVLEMDIRYDTIIGNIYSHSSSVRIIFGIALQIFLHFSICYGVVNGYETNG